MGKRNEAKDTFVGPTYRERLGHTKYEDPGIDCSNDEPITEQNHIPDCDINTLLARIEKGGIPLEQTENVQNDFIDASQGQDLHEVMNIVANAQNTFNGLPARVRAFYNNDPALMWEALNNPNPTKEQVYAEVRMGLRKPEAMKRFEKQDTKPSNKEENVSVSTITSSGKNASPKKGSPTTQSDEGD